MEYFTETEYRDLKIKSLEILTEIALFAAILDDELKYNPSQPRVPAGYSNGGQWTDGGNYGAPSGKPQMTRIPNSNPLFRERAPKPKPLPQTRPLDDGHVEPSYIIEEAIGLATGIGAIGRGIFGAVGAARNTRWVLGSHKTATKWANRLEKGNWTPKRITNTIKSGKKFPAPNLVNPANSATRYQSGNRFVVRDDVTKEILQVSRKGKFYPLELPPQKQLWCNF